MVSKDKRVVLPSQRVSQARYIVLWRDNHWTHGAYCVCWDHFTDQPRRFTTRREAEKWARLSFGPFSPRKGALIETKRTQAVVRHESKFKKFLASQSHSYMGNLGHDRRYPVGD